MRECEIRCHREKTKTPKKENQDSHLYPGIYIRSQLMIICKLDINGSREVKQMTSAQIRKVCICACA